MIQRGCGFFVVCAFAYYWNLFSAGEWSQQCVFQFYGRIPELVAPQADVKKSKPLSFTTCFYIFFFACKITGV